MRKKLLFGFMAVALVLGTVLVGCVKAPAPTEEFTYVSWGACSCISGPSAPWGILQDRCQPIGADDINGDVEGVWPKEGFEVGGEKYKWKVFKYDSRSKPEESIKCCSRLIYEDKCKYIIIMDLEPYMAARPMFLDNDILVIFTEYGSKGMMADENPMTFRCVLPPLPRGYAVFPWFKENLGVKTAAVVTCDIGTERSIRDTMLKGVEGAGIELVADEFYDKDATDFYPLLTRILAKDPDMIAKPAGTPPMYALMIKQARELGYTKPIFMDVALPMKELLEITGMEYAENVYGTEVLFPLTPRQEWLRDEYIRRHGEAEWNTVVFDYIDAIYLVTMAIEKAQSFDTWEVAKALETMPPEEVVSFLGEPARWGGMSAYGHNHQLCTPFSISRFENGEKVMVSKATVHEGF